MSHLITIHLKVCFAVSIVLPCRVGTFTELPLSLWQ